MLFVFEVLNQNYIYKFSKSSLTKHLKHYVRSILSKMGKTGRPSYYLDTKEVIESLKKKYKHTSKLLEMKPQQLMEKEYVNINKLIWIAIENNQEKSAM